MREEAMFRADCPLRGVPHAPGQQPEKMAAITMVASYSHSCCHGSLEVGPEMEGGAGSEWLRGSDSIFTQRR